MRRLLAVFAVLTALAVLMAGCGDDQPIRETSGTTTTGGPSTTEGTAPPEAVASGDLADVEVDGEPGEQPTLSFDQPFGVAETAALVLTEGDGDAIEPGKSVMLDFVFVNARDGSVLSSSYEAEPATLVFEETLMAGIYTGLNGVTAGSRVLIGIAPTDGMGADPTTGLLETDTLLFFAEILSVTTPLQRAEGEAVAPVDGLPTVVLGADGAPTITVPDAEAPTELIAQPLIEGAGAVVEAGQTITVHYTGVLWDTGAVFDSSWESGTPASFAIGTGAVIPGWDEGLVGRTIGSQILLVVPPDKGYREAGSGEAVPPNATLVFVIDILAAT